MGNVAQQQSDWNASSGVTKIKNKPSLVAVATSGAYSDLSGTPSLGTAAGHAATDFDAAGAASTAQSNAETFAANASNISSGTLAAARVATLNQSTTGTAGNITATSNGTLTSLSSMGLAYAGGIVTVAANLKAANSGDVWVLNGGTFSVDGDAQFQGDGSGNLNTQITSDTWQTPSYSGGLLNVQDGAGWIGDANPIGPSVNGTGIAWDDVAQTITITANNGIFLPTIASVTITSAAVMTMTSTGGGTIVKPWGGIAALIVPLTTGTPISPSPTAGQLIYNNSDHHFYGWNGSAWKQLDN